MGGMSEEKGSLAAGRAGECIDPSDGAETYNKQSPSCSLKPR